jgi:c-di-GMP-binding flagellar brake protein YcgR
MFPSTAVATAVAIAIERRRGKRYLLRLACRVTSWDGHFEEMQGTTTDISRTGVRVVFPDEVALPMLRIGETACVLVDLPESSCFTPRQLECMSRVVRIGDEDPTGPTAAFEIVRARVRERDGRPVDEDLTTKLLQ